jgi:DHA1 family bicyclomycin/chloramphenicol resistance-like MFS transporter
MIGSSLLAIFCIILLSVVSLTEPSLYLFVGMIVITTGAIPISGPIASSVFMQLYKTNIGTASACMGVARVLFGMTAGFIVTLAHNGTLHPMTIIMCVIALLGMVCFYKAGSGLSSNV